jgi:hypothetical protein
MLIVYRADEHLLEFGGSGNDDPVRILRIAAGRSLTLRGGLRVGIALRGLFITGLKIGAEQRQSQ